MNYPIWELPAAGLLIAAVAIIHVFISHFAVGGGLFLVLAERKARREEDPAFLAYLQRHSRFFAVLTLVVGAVTGVGIWFTIALVSPTATSSLINTFVWGWAIEWTFFAIEICAAMIYYYGWDRLSARTHEIVGWIYFWAAWLSLVIINGILAYMLTPGTWVLTRDFWDGFLNPTYVSSVVARTLVAVALAGLYALWTVSASQDEALKEKVSYYATSRWILPAAVLTPLTLVWYLFAAASAGVPVASILGAPGRGPMAILGAGLIGSAPSGYPMALRGLQASLIASILIVVLTLTIMTRYRRNFGHLAATTLLLLGFVAFGGAEFVREDLRKPYVIGRYMFVNGIRLPALDGVPQPPADAAWQAEDPFAIDALQATGVLAAAKWDAAPAGFDSHTGVISGSAEGGGADLTAQDRIDIEVAAGHEVFKLECFTCHTVAGHLGIRPLVEGLSPTAIEGTLDRLARPVDSEGSLTTWDDPEFRLESWRERRMPPFVGTDAERRALAIYLASVGGADLVAAARLGEGAEYFESECVFCHGPEEDWPLADLLQGGTRSTEDFYEILGRLPEVNDLMIDFEGSEEQRQAVAEFLLSLQSSGGEQ
jgi:mono/diheme cytochrome c family protein